MGQPVVHFEIEGRDARLLRTFYSALFGWTITVDNHDSAEYGLIDHDYSNRISGAVSRVPNPPSTTWRGPSRDDGYPGHVTIYVEVPDIEAALAQAEKLGGTRMLGPDHIAPGIHIGKITDPEGHLIGLVNHTPTDQ